MTAGQYAEVAQVRALGVTVDAANDDTVSLWLKAASRYIETATGGFWFEKRTLTLQLDGNDQPVLELPAPLLSATSVKVFNVVVQPGSYVIRNQRELQDFWWPRIEWVALPLRMERAFGTGGPFGQRAGFWNAWTWGQRNIEIAGDWGFVEEDFSTPALITRACAQLAANLTRKGDDRFSLYLDAETFGNYRYEYGERGQGDLITGDVEVDQVIAMYRRAPTVGAA